MKIKMHNIDQEKNEIHIEQIQEKNSRESRYAMALPCQHEQLRILQNFASKTGPLCKELLVLGHSPSNSLVSALKQHANQA
jgi:hypothetical protein